MVHDLNDLLMFANLLAVEPLSIGEPIPVGDALLPSLVPYEDLVVCGELLPACEDPRPCKE